MKNVLLIALLFVSFGAFSQSDTIMINQIILSRIDSINAQQQKLIPQVNQYIALENQKSSVVLTMLQTLGFQFEPSVGEDGREYQKLMKGGREYVVSGNKIYYKPE